MGVHRKKRETVHKKNHPQAKPFQRAGGYRIGF